MDITTALMGAHLVSGVLGELLNRNQPPEMVAAGPSDGGSLTLASASGITADLREIVGRYDVTDITPRQFTEMIQSLHQAGAVSDQQLQELSLIRIDLDLEGLDPDESLDLLDFFADKLKDLAQVMDDYQSDAFSTDGPPPIGPVQHRLEWLQKFALLQSAPDTFGLDALA